jgi:hypothetical protein
LNIYRPRFAYACSASAHAAIRITPVPAITIVAVSAISVAIPAIRAIKSVIVYPVPKSKSIKWSIDIEYRRIKSRVTP